MCVETEIRDSAKKLGSTFIENISPEKFGKMEQLFEKIGCFPHDTLVPLFVFKEADVMVKNQNRTAFYKRR